MCLLLICVSSLEKYLFKSFAHILIFFFFTIELKYEPSLINLPKCCEVGIGQGPFPPDRYSTTLESFVAKTFSSTDLFGIFAVYQIIIKGGSFIRLPILVLR